MRAVLTSPGQRGRRALPAFGSYPSAARSPNRPAWAHHLFRRPRHWRTTTSPPWACPGAQRAAAGARRRPRRRARARPGRHCWRARRRTSSTGIGPWTVVRRHAALADPDSFCPPTSGVRQNLAAGGPPCPAEPPRWRRRWRPWRSTPCSCGRPPSPTRRPTTDRSPAHAPGDSPDAHRPRPRKPVHLPSFADGRVRCTAPAGTDKPARTRRALMCAALAPAATSTSAADLDHATDLRANGDWPAVDGDLGAIDAVAVRQRSGPFLVEGVGRHCSAVPMPAHRITSRSWPPRRADSPARVRAAASACRPRRPPCSCLPPGDHLRRRRLPRCGLDVKRWLLDHGPSAPDHPPSLRSGQAASTSTSAPKSTDDAQPGTGARPPRWRGRRS